MKNRWKKIIMPIFALVASCLIFPIFITSCSHISTEYESNGYTTFPNKEKTIIHLTSLQNIQFTKEYFWDNLDYFKQLIVNNNVFPNTEILAKEISIPYSSISVSNLENKKSFTCKIFLQKYYYKGRLIELSNTSFGSGNEYIATIPSETFNKFISYDFSSNETIILFQDYIIQHLDDYFFSFPPSVSKEDLVIKNINAVEGGSKLSITFEFRAIYNNNGEKSRTFTISYVPQTSRNKNISINKLSNTKLNDFNVSSNVNSTKIQFII